ncbi:hypothetical protein [Furfurilactobacillus entadae]|uniref:hypothetical protein n=1 Tax=Furfurilactobacillus entadae TaxID=2922307 RepID=UPI0035EFAD5A
MKLNGWDWVSTFSLDKINQKLSGTFNTTHVFSIQNSISSMSLTFDGVQMSGDGSQKYTQLQLTVKEGVLTTKNTKVEIPLNNISPIVKVSLSFFNFNGAMNYGINIQSNDDVTVVDPDSSNTITNSTYLAIIKGLLKDLFLQERETLKTIFLSIMLPGKNGISAFSPTDYTYAAITLSNGQQFISVFVATQNQDIKGLSTTLDTSLLSGSGEYLFIDCRESGFYPLAPIGMVGCATEESNEKQLVMDLYIVNTSHLDFIRTIKFNRDDYRQDIFEQMAKLSDVRMGTTYLRHTQRGAEDGTVFFKWA